MKKEKKSSYVMGMRNKLKGAYLWHTRTTSNIAFPCGSAAPTMEKKECKLQVSALCTMHHTCLYGMMYLQCNGSKSA